MELCAGGWVEHMVGNVVLECVTICSNCALGHESMKARPSEVIVFGLESPCGKNTWGSLARIIELFEYIFHPRC